MQEKLKKCFCAAEDLQFSFGQLVHDICAGHAIICALNGHAIRSKLASSPAGPLHMPAPVCTVVHCSTVLCYSTHIRNDILTRELRMVCEINLTNAHS